MPYDYIDDDGMPTKRNQQDETQATKKANNKSMSQRGKASSADTANTARRNGGASGRGGAETRSSANADAATGRASKQMNGAPSDIPWRELVQMVQSDPRFMQQLNDQLDDIEKYDDSAERASVGTDAYYDDLDATLMDAGIDVMALTPMDYDAIEKMGLEAWLAQRGAQLPQGPSKRELRNMEMNAPNTRLMRELAPQRKSRDALE